MPTKLKLIPLYCLSLILTTNIHSFFECYSNPRNFNFIYALHVKVVLRKFLCKIVELLNYSGKNISPCRLFDTLTPYLMLQFYVFQACEGKERVLYIGITCGLSAPYVAGQLDYCMDNPGVFTPVLLGFNPVSLAR